MPRTPYGGGNGNGDVIDLDALRFRARRFWRRFFLPILIAAAALIAATTSYYQVEAEEVALVRRFGAYLGPPREPGPHARLPFGIDRVVKVPVQRTLKHEFGFRTDQAAVRTVFRAPGRDTQAESIMLTGDLNVVLVEWIVQYRIRDPYKYVFKVRNVEETFRAIAEASMREVVGDHSVTEVLTVGRERVAARAKELLQELADRYQTGISVEQLVLQDVDPPEPVQDSFNEVNQAIQERERMINEAWGEYNRAVPRARGEAERTLRAAEGYATERVNNARGEAERFVAQQTEYARSPRVTRTRLHLETLARVLPKAGRRVIVDESARNLLPLLHLEGAGR